MKNIKEVVLITGCSSGIGRSLALEFASVNYRVFATARDKDSIKDLEREGIECLNLDVTDPESVRNAVSDLIKAAGKIDYLINNAGFLLTGPAIEIPLQDIRTQLETNVIGALALIQEVAPYMIKQRSGRIINVGSISAIMVTPFGGIYSGSKADLHAVSEALRLELKPFGIKVITTITGGVKSSLSDKGNLQLKKDSVYQSIANGVNRRARMSQDNAMDTGEFATKFLRAVTKRKPASRIKIGQGAKFYYYLKMLLPARIFDNIRSKRFDLDKI